MRMNHTAKIAAPRLKALSALIPLLLVAAPIGAVQTGQIAAGSGTINTAGAITTINQQTDRMVINWNSFDIGAGERVQFNQPGTSSAVLNRVNSANRTQIDGALNANGQVFVVNPNGVVVGKTGSVNANGVVLSTLDIADGNFMHPQDNPSPYSLASLSFNRKAGAADGAVVNDGAIAAGEGGVSLFGAQVINSASGSIYAKGVTDGTDEGSRRAGINLVAGNKVILDKPNEEMGYVAPKYLAAYRAKVVDGLAANDGAIKVDYGDVLLDVTGGLGAVNESLRNTGSIEANGPTAFGNVTLDSAGGLAGGQNRGSRVGGTINGGTVTVNYQNDTILDGTMNAARITSTGYKSLLVADSARLDAGYVQLRSDKIVVNGQINASTSARLLGYDVSVREGAITSPDWKISR